MGKAATVNQTPSYTLTDILKGSEYALTIFNDNEIKALNVYDKNGKPYLTCAATDKPRPAKPEEIVRQLYLAKLIQEYGYPKGRIAIEKKVYFGSDVHEKAADIVIAEKDAGKRPYIIIEVKKPKRKDGLEQLKSYCNAEGSPIGVWTNGSEVVALHREDPNIFRNLPDIPKDSQTLSAMLDQPWTLDDLRAKNRLVVERTSLKDIILDMEDLVLANAGVDAFEEVFKLIFAKLFDERNATRGGKKKRYLEFRVGSRTPTEVTTGIGDLFARACKEWPGVFDEGTKIDLEPDHLKVCASFLEDVKLFNSNLSVIDEAFEYLSVQASKGEKGQYFTPRHVIDMAVKMLNPTVDEYVIDTAAGSCGFTVHAIAHVWGDLFGAEEPEAWQKEYAATHVYAIDFDKRATKIARALNLIAGDGRTNVYRANSLLAPDWGPAVRVGFLPRLRRFAERSQDEWNQVNFRYFDFDVLLTNPPFAGDIKETRILHQYELAKTSKGKWENSVGRDILFIERNLQFLKPGGRAAIVLPQGRFNNSGDETIRKWIADRARILAVVGLHGNTFKPHTGTKTSVLFIQTWNDDKKMGLLNPKQDDYPVFLATSMMGGKDNRGDYIYRIGPDNAPMLDIHNHMIVEHDLNEIASEFVKWGKAQRLSFCEGAE
jgi:type I restriction enzyme M protein